MSYFAAALARTEAGWTGVELDLDEVEDLESLTDLLRDLTGEGPGPALMLLEENDEHVAVVRVDGGTSGLDDPRVFLSDRRAIELSDVAAMLYEGDEPPEDEQENDEGPSPIAEPLGDTTVLADLGTGPEQLLDLVAEEGLLPADVLTTLCERAGCDDVLESLREG